MCCGHAVRVSILNEKYTALKTEVKEAEQIRQNDKIAVLKSAYDRERFKKANDLAYSIIKLRNAISAVEEEVASLKNEIRETLKDADYILNAKQKSDGIQEIFDEALFLE